MKSHPELQHSQAWDCVPDPELNFSVHTHFLPKNVSCHFIYTFLNCPRGVLSLLFGREGAEIMLTPGCSVKGASTFYMH